MTFYLNLDPASSPMSENKMGPIPCHCSDVTSLSTHGRSWSFYFIHDYVAFTRVTDTVDTFYVPLTPLSPQPQQETTPSDSTGTEIQSISTPASLTPDLSHDTDQPLEDLSKSEQDVTVLEHIPGVDLVTVKQHLIKGRRDQRKSKAPGQEWITKNRKYQNRSKWNIPITHEWYKRVKDLLELGGSPTSVYISKSTIHGHGIFTNTRIPKGTIIMVYMGDVISVEEQNSRERQGLGGRFVQFTHGRVIDGKSKARFVNHSCKPNTTLELLTFSNGAACVVISASRRIYPFEELTTNYKWEKDDESGNTKLHCNCGVPSCRKYMSPSRSK